MECDGVRMNLAKPLTEYDGSGQKVKMVDELKSLWKILQSRDDSFAASLYPLPHSITSIIPFWQEASQVR